MKVITQPTRSGEGCIIRVGGQAAAWVDASGGSTIGRRYRDQLAGAPVPPDVLTAIERARKKVRARPKRATR
jgi:hypothetical protein